MDRASLGDLVLSFGRDLDGITWSVEQIPNQGVLESVVWTGSQIVVGSYMGAVYASPDDVNWTPLSSGTFADLLSVVWTGARLVVVAGSTTILTSPCAVPACTAPGISAQPQSVVAPPGRTVTLTVQAAGTQPLSYQWYQGAAGDTSASVGAGSDTFSTVPLAGASSFWVRVSNACGDADSEAATVTVGCRKRT